MDPAKISKHVKYLLSISISFCYFTFGLSTAMLGPCRLDLAELIGVDFDQISYGTVTRAAGNCAGSILFGWLFHRLNRQLGFASCLSVCGMAMFVIPFAKTLWLYMLSELVYGFAGSGIDVTINSWLLEIWLDDANPYMQALYLMFAFGTTISPLIAQPFLSVRRSPDLEVSAIIMQNETIIRQESRIVIPYSIAACFLMSAALLMIFLFFKFPYKSPKRDITSSPCHDKTSELPHEVVVQEDQNYCRWLILYGSLISSFYAGVEITTFGFFPEFAVVIDLQLSKSQAAGITSAMSAAFTISRLICILVATKVTAKLMLISSLLMLITGNILLSLFANTSTIMLWVAVMIIGAGHSSVNPCLMSYLEERMNVTTFACGLFMFSSYLSSLILPILMGSFIQPYPIIFPSINIFLLCLSLVLFLALLLLDHRFKRISQPLARIGNE